MKQRSIFFFLLSILFYNFQCNQCEDAMYDKSSYTADITPLQEIYAIGDTILLGTSFSSSIPLENSGITYDNSNKTMSYVVQIFEVKPNNQLIESGIENFDLSTSIGQLSFSKYWERRLAEEITNTCGNTLCEFQIEIVPKKKGIYCFNLLRGGFGDQYCEFFDLLLNDFRLNDNNFEICQEIYTTNFRVLNGGTYYSNPEDIKSFYFFKVE